LTDSLTAAAAAVQRADVSNAAMTDDTSKLTKYLQTAPREVLLCGLLRNGAPPPLIYCT